MSALARVLDAVIARYAAGEHEAEAVRARTAFLEATGQVHDDEPMFEERLQAFLEWYTLERPMEDCGLRPIERYRQEETLSPEDAEAAAALASSHWSLFQTIEVEPGKARIDDLLSGGRFVVHERRKLLGLEPGDVFEARLVSEGGRTLFGRTFCFHPRDATDAIRGFIEEASRAGEQKESVLFKLADRRMRCERYHNMQVAKIYSYRWGQDAPG